jgi:hypothetical protein
MQTRPPTNPHLYETIKALPVFGGASFFFGNNLEHKSLAEAPFENSSCFSWYTYRFGKLAFI